MAATFTKHSATLKQGRGTSLRHAAAAIVDHETAEVVAGHTFTAVCAATLGDKSISAIVSALYYLPQNFIIKLPEAFAKASGLADMLTGSAIKNQIEYYDERDSSQKDESFSSADVIIGGETDTSVAIVPAEKYSELAVKEFGYTVGRSPEAIASSLLKYARDE